jgi:hypothetical protein
VNQNPDAVLRYWRTSLADSALGDGKFSVQECHRLIELPSETLRNGQLPLAAIDRLFKGQPRAKTVGARLWPLVVARRTSHGAGRGDGLPHLVAPVVTEALIDREGRILPQRNAIARDVLTPLPLDEFSIGTVEALDDFLTAEPLRLNTPYDWAAYLAHCRKMVDAVTKGWPEGDQNYRPAGYGLLEPAEDASATVRNILDLYDKILADQPQTPLLASMAAPLQGAAADPAVEHPLARRLGHSNPHFPLAEPQRQVLAWLDAAKQGQVIAVNGPPGTGKTTLLLSAVAGLWVRAALEGDNPPVIVAASSNNQAVTNIIDAFGKDFAAGDGPFAGRWLPGVDSFGIFLPANSRKQEAAQKYQTEEFQTRMETVEGFEAARDAWLISARAAFPNLAGDVAIYVAALQRAIALDVAKLHEADRSLAQLSLATRNAQSLGPDPQASEDQAQANLGNHKRAADVLQRQRAAFDRQQAAESSFIALFSFLPAVERKRVLRARLALDGVVGIEHMRRVTEIDQHLTQALSAARSTVVAAEGALRRIRELRAELTAARSARNQALLALGGEEGLEDRLDLGLRFDLFRLATHYWEGRWLMAMESDLTTITASAAKTGRATLVPRWQRRMMLTPCAVSTFASLPPKLACSHRDGGKWAS